MITLERAGMPVPQDNVIYTDNLQCNLQDRILNETGGYTFKGG